MATERRETSTAPPPWGWLLFALALVFALREAKAFVAPVVIAVVLTFVLAPAVRWLRRHGVPEVLGAALVVLALLGSTVPLAATLVQPAEQWWDKAPATFGDVAAKVDRLRGAIPGLAPPQPAQPRRAGPPAAADPLKDRIASEGVVLTGRLVGGGIDAGVTFGATMILLYFLLASEHWMLSRCVEAIPRLRTRALVLGRVRAAQRAIGRYIQAVAYINAALALLTALALWLLGLPNPTLWGAVVLVLSFVPYLGPMAICGLLLLAGITTFDELPGMVAPMLAYLALHAVEANFVSPWFVGRQLALSPISVFLSVMFWGWLWGIPGALIAVPMLIALRSVCHRSQRLRLLCRFLDGDQRGMPTLPALLRSRPRGPAPRRPAVVDPDCPCAAPLMTQRRLLPHPMPPPRDAAR